MRHLLLSAALLALAAPAMAEPRPIAFADAPPAGSALVLPLANLDGLARAPFLDSAARAAVTRAARAEEFDFKEGSTLLLRGLEGWPRLLVVGTGTAPLTAAKLQDIGGLAAQQLSGVNGPVAIATSTIDAQGPAPGAQIAVGARLGGYSFDRYKSADPEKPASPGKSAPIVILSSNAGDRTTYEGQGRALADSANFARDLIHEPANAIYPESFVERARDAFKGVRGVTIRVLDVPQMERLGMGSILSVGKGSARPPRMMIVQYSGNASAPLVALAGKGITFDTGGISLKPGSGMSAMKGDMAGAAAVVATALSLAKARAPVNVVAIAALAENMPGGTATRPGDVVKAMNGKTIEILNTDAEGRLVLADAVAFAEREYRPAAIVDIATLTGSVRGALGDEYAGLLTRNDALAAQLTAAGSATGEELWRLPLHPSYAKDMKSDIADIKNVVEGGAPGAGYGAHFIGAFVESTPWAHLDIAGVDSRSSSLPTVPEGLSGFGVRLLDRFVRDFRPVPAEAAGGN